MKKKIAFGLLVFLVFCGIVIGVIVKENRTRDELSAITGETIRNALQNDDGMGIDEISDEFSKEVLELAGYKNIADIACIKVDEEKVYLVYIESNLENAFYLATRLIDEIEEKTLLITWNGKEYEISKAQAESNDEFANMFPQEWQEMFENGIQIGVGDADRIDDAIEKVLDEFN